MSTEKVAINEKKPNSIEWFSYRLSRNQGYYLYIISIIGLLYCIGFLFRIVNPMINVITSEDLNITRKSFYLFNDIVYSAMYLGMICLFSYSLIKIKPLLSKPMPLDMNSYEKWFGISINKKQAPLLFILGIGSLFYSIFDFFSRFDLLLSFSYYLQENIISIQYIFLYLVNTILFSIFSIYTIITVRNLKTNKSESRNWFGFVLNKSSRPSIFFGSLIGIFIAALLSISFLLSGFHSGLYFFTDVGREEFHIDYLSDLVDYSILAGIFLIGFLLCLYSLYQVWKMRDYENEKDLKESVRCFSFELSKIKAYSFYYLSIIGIMICLAGVFLIIPSLLDQNLFGWQFFAPLYVILMLIYSLAILTFLYTLNKIYGNRLTLIAGEEDQESTKWFGIEVRIHQGPTLFLFGIMPLIISSLIIFSFYPFKVIGFIYMIFSLYTIAKSINLIRQKSGENTWIDYLVSSQIQPILYIGSIYLIVFSLSLTLIFSSRGIFHIISDYYWVFFDFLMLGLLALMFILSTYSFLRIRKEIH